jgi:hypothetical protein
MRRPILLDAHGHLHNQWDIRTALQGAFQNFARALSNLGSSPPFSAFVFLCSSPSTLPWSTLGEHLVDIKKQGPYQMEEDQHRICFIDNEGNSISLLPGHQIVSQESLEILSIGRTHGIPSGPAEGIIESLLAGGTLIILPWGTGKWLGSRGKLVDTLLERFGSSLLLGDNSGRPTIWRNVPQFQTARTRGIAILPGTDPLPIPHHQNRLGSFGCALPAEVKPHSLEELAQLISSSIPIRSYGTLETLFGFFRSQIGIRLRKKAIS